ncbi:MAG: class I SAM-dependent methyltransferase [Acidobacteria bacterium]|nr:class I SAM-dependent methyltransferase [Acidobacteriota bacterium]
MQTEWWEEFFSGLALELWRAAVTEDQTRAEVDFVEQLLRLPVKGKVLDVPCGNGRHSLELASRHYDVTGVDLAPDFVAEARSMAAQRKLQGRWERRDMRDLPWAGEFDGAFCFGNSFGYLDDEGNAAFLKAVHRALKPGARFIVDASTCAEIILPIYEERSWQQVGDILFLEQNHYDHLLSRYETEYTFVRDGKVERRHGSHRVYTFRELIGLLAATGFVNWEAYGSLRQAPFRLGSQCLFMVTAKADA